MTFGELFAGIGGFSLGLERAGMECKWQVEIDRYASAVLAKHWPNVRRHDDVRTFPPHTHTHTHTHTISALTSSRVVSRAKISALPEKAQASPAVGLVFGTILQESFAQFSRDGWSSKTCQLSLLEDSEPFLETWPKSGSIVNGIAYQLVPLVRRIVAKECGSWATPVANRQAAASIPALLNEAKRLHPRGQWTLATQVAAEHVHGHKMWPTPTVQDASNNAGPSQFRRNSLPLNAAIGGALNPTWVEWLMGFPPGWTDLDALAMPLYPKSLKSSGARSCKRKK